MRRLTATAAVGLVGLSLVAVGATTSQARTAAPRATLAAATLRVGVSTVLYDSPGATVPAIVTVYNAPAGHQVAISATSTAGSTVTCSGPVWRNPVRRSASRTCYLRLPNRAGSYTVKGTARVTAGTVVKVVSSAGSRPVKADGQASPIPMSAATVQQIERCHNATNDVWLTFDDGGSPAQVASILATLSRNNVKARFFFRGDWARANPTLLPRIKAAGHIIGNHTSTHRSLSRESTAAVLKQVDAGTAATGSPKLLRPPFGAGALTTKLQRDVQQRGYQLCRWTTDTYDWDSTTVPQMVERITYGDYRSAPVTAGGNILLHAHGKHTAPGLQKIINAVRAKKLRLQPLR